MDYLTNYYRNLSEQLQERLNFLQNLLEDNKAKGSGVSGLDSQHGGLPIEKLEKQTAKEDPSASYPGPKAYTTFNQFHKSIYGDKSEELIKDALAARQAAKGTEHDLSGLAVLGDYEKYGNSPIRFNINFPQELLDTAYANTKLRSAELGTDDPNKENIVNVGNETGPFTSRKGILRHEVEHTVTPEIFNARSDPRTIAKTAKEPIEVVSKEEKYHYDPYELPAFQSEYEAEYFMDTGKTLKSNLTDQEYGDFMKWGETTGKIRNQHLDLMKSSQYKKQMMDLAKQVAKIGKQSNNGQMMA